MTTPLISQYVHSTLGGRRIVIYRYYSGGAEVDANVLWGRYGLAELDANVLWGTLWL